MPLISDLKKLGTLPVPELKTVLAVYLINLEHSQETNLVYVPRDSVSSDVSPPSSLLFECAETHTKGGDVLIWASRNRERAKSVLSCWVFDGAAWKKTNSDLKVMMDHPKHPEYQLVILPGPSVNWQLKSDTVCEPPLTGRRPPRARSHTLATMNTIITDVPGYQSQRSCELNAESGTPDGSAGLCGSSTGSPSSESLSDTLHGFEKLPTTAIPYNPNKHATESLYPHSSDPLSQTNSEKTVFGRIPKTPKRFPSRRRSSTNHILATPQEGRASPDDHVTPVETLSSKSTSQSINHTVTIPVTPPRSAPPSPLKRARPRSSPEHEYAWPVSHSSSSTNHGAVQSSPFPAARRRRLEDGEGPSQAAPSYLLTLKDAVEDMDADADADADAEGEDDSDICAEDIVVSLAQGNEQKVEQQSTAPPGSKTPAALERPEGNGVESAEQNLSAALNLQEKLPGPLSQGGESLDTALHLAQQLHGYILRSASGLAESKKENDLKLQKLQGERDHAIAALDDLKQSEEKVRNACREANELANTLKTDLQVLRQSESSLLQARDDLGKQLVSAQLELDRLVKAHQTRLESDAKQLEETKERLEEQRGRADHFEKSLRVAQEALQRQRTLAQEAEACQRNTIAQLAKELREKDQSAKQLAEEGATMTKRIAELGASLSASEHAIGNEKENVRRVMDELEGVRTTVKVNRAQIERLNASRVEDGRNLAAAEEQVSTLNARIEQLQKEGAAHDAALSKEVERREKIEKDSETIQMSMGYLDRLRQIAEAQLLQEYISKQEAESQRDFQKFQFSEYLSLTDKERGRLEHLFFEEGASLRQDLRVVGRDLESAKAECLKLKVERDSERDKLNAEVASKQRRLDATLKEQKTLQHQLQSKVQQVKDAQRDCAQARSSAAADRDKFNKDQSSLRVETERELSVLRGRVAENVEAKKQAEGQCAALDAKAKEKSKALKVKHTEYKQLQAELSSERERLKKEVTSTRRRLEAQLEDSQRQMKILREEHDTTVRDFQVERASFESKLQSAADALASSQAAVSQKNAKLHADRERFDADQSSTRLRCSYVQKDLNDAQQQCRQMKETLAKERASFSEEREQLVSERTSAQEQLSSLETKLSELQGQLQASFKEQQSESAVKLSATQQLIKELEGQLSDAEQRHTNLENLFSDERAGLEEKLRNNSLELEKERTKCATTTTELGDERQRVEELSSSRTALEKELDSCRSQLALIEEKGTRAEAVQADLRLQYSSVSAKLETVQAEHEHLKAILSAERERFQAERSMSQDSLRGKVASLETCLEREQAITRALREEQTKDMSSDYWSELSSQLLSSLHKAQDRLRDEERAHQALQVQMAGLSSQQ